MENRIQRIIFSIGLIILFSIFIWSINTNSAICEMLIPFNEKKISGKIDKIGLIKEGGRDSGEMIFISSNKEYFRLTAMNRFALFDSIQVGDSIFKEKNETQFLFFRNKKYLGKMSWEYCGS
jgi:hypothetical protein